MRGDAVNHAIPADCAGGGDVSLPTNGIQHDGTPVCPRACSCRPMQGLLAKLRQNLLPLPSCALRRRGLGARRRPTHLLSLDVRHELALPAGRNPRGGRPYVGLTEATQRLGQRAFQRLRTSLQGSLPKGLRSARARYGCVAMAVDGSRVEAPRARVNQRNLGRAGRDKTGPRWSVTGLIQLPSGLIWERRQGPRTSTEHAHSRQILSTPPPNTPLLAEMPAAGGLAVAGEVLALALLLPQAAAVQQARLSGQRGGGLADVPVGSGVHALGLLVDVVRLSSTSDPAWQRSPSAFQTCARLAARKERPVSQSTRFTPDITTRNGPHASHGAALRYLTWNVSHSQMEDRPLAGQSRVLGQVGVEQHPCATLQRSWPRRARPGMPAGTASLVSPPPCARD